MKVVSQLSDAATHGPCVLTIGNFDGLHLGHQRILSTVVERARKLRMTPAVLTFDPHPVRVLAPAQAPRLINTLDQKLRLIEGMGIELVFIAAFNPRFAALSPDEFVQEYLVDGLGAKLLCVGSNFIFGHRQAGTLESLQRWRHAFELLEIEPVVARGIVVSSTQIRQRIQEGRVSRACRMLGRWFEIEGRIAPGEGRGRQVTVPTLNLEPDNELVPRTGVYITRTAMDSGDFIDSITNVGTRPTFNGSSQSIETFVLGGAVPATVARTRLQFLKRVRDERRFDSPELLREQIGRDVQAARRFFRMLRTGTNAGIHSN
ncbi:MAG TPA: bifunctional riboflavin kinase/FAD synthetase [Terriglobia bacterium]|nr:bifunctional riboflavin kinase/FAD synthetase [Terriglobia bacterium]